MLRRRALLRWLTLGLIVACPLSLRGADMAGQEPKTPVAHLEVQPARIDWMPQADYERLVLTVAGPEDLYIQREFGAGETPFFSSLDVQGGRLPDGVYAYELRAVPRLELDLREKPTKAREVGDDSVLKELQKEGSRPESPLVQSGHLWIQGGSFMDKIPVPRAPSSPGESASKPPTPNFTAKTTINDDLIVKAQACIGAGCVEGMADVPALKLRELFDTKIVFENDGCCTPYSNNWALQANDSSNSNGNFLIRDLTYNTSPFKIGPIAPDNALTILSFSGNVGLGTLTPAAALHVTRSTGALATLARFSNNLGIQVLYDRTDAGANDWQTSNFNATFQISVPGAAPPQFSLNANGNLTIGGTLTELSSRDAKTNFESLDPVTVLARLDDLPISVWSYRQDTSARHIGPMAEDFHKAFGLGVDDKTIAPGDKAGVALAAIKGLHQVVQEKDTEIAELENRIEALEELVQSLAQERAASDHQQ